MAASHLFRYYLHHIRTNGLTAACLVKGFGRKNDVGRAYGNTFDLKNGGAGIITLERIDRRGELLPGYFHHFLIVGRANQL